MTTEATRMAVIGNMCMITRVVEVNDFKSDVKFDLLGHLKADIVIDISIRDHKDFITDLGNFWLIFIALVARWSLGPLPSCFFTLLFLLRKLALRKV